MTAYVASTVKRFWARTIDQLILTLVLAPLVIFLHRDGSGWLNVPIGTALGVVLVPLFYESLFYYLMKATPGKWIFNLKVLPAQDAKEENWLVRCVLRAATSYLSFFFSWAIYATALWRPDRTHICDWVADTRVVGNVSLEPKKRRTFLTIILVVIGFFSGLKEAQVRLSEISYAEGFVRVRDPLHMPQKVDF